MGPLKVQNTSPLDLLLFRQFYPLFWVQFLGAFNDNLFKNALVILITFQLSHSALSTGLLITFAAGLFILPFFLFSSVAGQLADRYPKDLLIRKIKFVEILVMLLGAIALLNQSLVLLFITLFLMGTQSAFFGPIKYAVLPEILDQDRLVTGNALMSGSTFIAILLGTILGGLGVMLENGLWIVSVAVVGVAIVGYGLSLCIQPLTSAQANLKIEWNVFKSTSQVIHSSRQYPTAFFSILAISWFWFIGAVLLSQIPALVKYDLYANDTVVIAYLTVFSVGIAIGAGCVGRLMPIKVHLHWHWLFLSGMSILILLTVWVIQKTDFTSVLNVSHETSLGLYAFITTWPANLSLLWLGVLSLFGGAYIVPLYTLLQTHTPKTERARIVAVNNIMNALLMVLSALLIMIGFNLEFSLLSMLTMLSLMNLAWIFVLYKNRFIARDRSTT